MIDASLGPLSAKNAETQFGINGKGGPAVEAYACVRYSTLLYYLKVDLFANLDLSLSVIR